MTLFFWANTTTELFNPLHEFSGSVEDKTWLKFGFYSKNSRIVDELWVRLRDYGQLELSNSDPLNIEVNPIGVNKASGLQLVCDRMGIVPNQVATIGDSLNDIPMIEWAGIGVAMGNAQGEVKHRADYVTTSCSENGVARAIERMILCATRDTSV